MTTPQQLDLDPFADRPEPRNSRRGDSFFSLDLRCSWVIGLGGRRSATALIEAYNVTNATNFTGYVGALSSSLFGQPTTALEKRRMQVGFRIEF